MKITLPIFVCMLAALPLRAEPPIRLRENISIDYQYHVSCRVDLIGQLTLPAEGKDSSPTTVDVRGTSAIEYDERVLEATTSDKPAPKTLRIYRRVDLERTVGDKAQDATLRPSVPESSRARSLRPRA